MKLEGLKKLSGKIIVNNTKANIKILYNLMINTNTSGMQDILVDIDTPENKGFIKDFGISLYLNIYYYINGDKCNQLNMGISFKSMSDEIIGSLKRFSILSVSKKTIKVVQIFTVYYNTDASNINEITYPLLGLLEEIKLIDSLN